LWIKEIIHSINASGLAINVATMAVFGRTFGDLAWILITAEDQGEYAEERKRCARRGIRE
jgi:hypothetical protein